MPTLRKPSRRAVLLALAAVGALALLAVVFGLYRNPELVVRLADQLWACM
ncbi:hypothetical protein [Corticibacter populi]|nr:hypothetical protein [Corticibacter populi]RZS32964.1 hypothetical protein EV687_1278 [Corticibacter populi]